MSLENSGPAAVRSRVPRRALTFVSVLLTIEFLDEVLFGVHEAAWPLIRNDLALTYTQIGLLLSVPPLMGNLVEPVYAILADVWRRRALVLAGGVAFAAACLLTGLSFSFAALLAATMLLNPASGLFVSLSQAALMDAEPERRERNMARWALAGSLGNCIGPVLVAAVVACSLSWRWLFAGLSIFSVMVLALAWSFPFPTPLREDEVANERVSTTARAFVEGLRGAGRALRRREVLRWLLLLQFGDFTWDVMRGFLALYFVDVTGMTEGHATMAVIILTWAGLPGDMLLLWLLKRVRGLSYLRVSTACLVLLFPSFLLAEGFLMKVSLLALMGLANAGWYAILQAQLYSELPGRSGTAMALSNLFGLAGSIVPLALGLFAERFGLGAAMWLLLIGPIGLLTGLLFAPASRRDSVDVSGNDDKEQASD